MILYEQDNKIADIYHYESWIRHDNKTNALKRKTDLHMRGDIFISEDLSTIEQYVATNKDMQTYHFYIKNENGAILKDFYSNGFESIGVDRDEEREYSILVFDHLI